MIYKVLIITDSRVATVPCRQVLRTPRWQGVSPRWMFWSSSGWSPLCHWSSLRLSTWQGDHGSSWYWVTDEDLLIMTLSETSNTITFLGLPILSWQRFAWAKLAGNPSSRNPGAWGCFIMASATRSTTSSYSTHFKVQFSGIISASHQGRVDQSWWSRRAWSISPCRPGPLTSGGPRCWGGQAPTPPIVGSTGSLSLSQARLYG